MLTLHRQFLKKIWAFLNHSATMFILGILVSLIFYWISLSDKAPSYDISKSSLIAKSTNERLKVTWDGIEYKNLYFVNLTVWNNGNEMIDNEDFIRKNPMQLYNTGDVKILSIITEKKSRSGINFKTDITNSGRKVIFELLNDEALEQNDGAVFHILYSRISNGKWLFNGRVKGIKTGFKKLDLKTTDIHKDRRSVIISWGIFLFFVLSRLIVVWVKKVPLTFKNFEVVFLLIFLSINLYTTINYCFYSTYLNWY